VASLREITPTMIGVNVVASVTQTIGTDTGWCVNWNCIRWGGGRIPH